MKICELDCEAGCPFRDEDLCNTGAPCFYDPPCAIYADDERNVEEIIEKIWERLIEEENRQDRIEQEKRIREAKKMEAARKRREANWVIREERVNIKALQKRILKYENALRFLTSIREINSMLNGSVKPDSKTIDCEKEWMAIIEKSKAEMAAWEAQKKEKLRALRLRRKQEGR